MSARTGGMPDEPFLVTTTLLLDLRGVRSESGQDGSAQVRNRLWNTASRAPRGAVIRLIVGARTPLPIEVGDLGLDRVRHWDIESPSPHALGVWQALLLGQPVPR